jgi:hypothetical protein
VALIVEDGTGLSTAESYISVANASAYHAARGNTAWAALASDTVREQCLRKATDYMVQQFRARWQGYRLNDTQALDWPRTGVVVDTYAVDDDIVPTAVANACAEFALKASSAELNPDLSQAIRREKIGPIETEYDTNSSQAKRYVAINAMVSPYLLYPAGTVATILV